MSSAEQERLVKYAVRLKDGTNIQIDANSVCRPTGTRKSYLFKSGDSIVAEFHTDHVVGWRMLESKK